jgi:hypothetical protein
MSKGPYKGDLLYVVGVSHPAFSEIMAEVWEV